MDLRFQFSRALKQGFSGLKATCGTLKPLQMSFNRLNLCYISPLFHTAKVVHSIYCSFQLHNEYSVMESLGYSTSCLSIFNIIPTPPREVGPGQLDQYRPGVQLKRGQLDRYGGGGGRNFQTRI